MHRVRGATRATSVQFAAESEIHLAPRLRGFGVRKRAKFREKTRERVANFWLTATANFGRRAARALRNAHDANEARLSQRCIWMTEQEQAIESAEPIFHR